MTVTHPFFNIDTTAELNHRLETYLVVHILSISTLTWIRQKGCPGRMSPIHLMPSSPEALLLFNMFWALQCSPPAMGPLIPYSAGGGVHSLGGAPIPRGK
jgi:hypothetical protein